ncbi:MAG: amidohydrolase family protein [Actinomycetota bacterium]|nr:amidohydrolase family protein [Nocardioidaceae bacterium]MDQ3592754.1 amidohydrolase family protein [Actinomycetota bacterium]
MTAALHVRGVVLPEGEHRDLYVVDGRVSYEPVADADDLTGGLERAWVVPGLVDAHCHVGLDADGAVDEQTQQRQATDDRDGGALLLRDCGSAADTRWIDARPDLPEIIRAGRHIARTRRYIRNYAHEVEPAELPAYVAQEAARGDGWVKLVGDWIERESGDLTPLWPGDAVRAAVSTAHAQGVRMTAHVFGAAALPDLIEAGIDCIEHGTGLSTDLVDAMVARGTALVPTTKQLNKFESYAAQGEAKFPAYAAHMRALFARRRETIGAAYEAGVAIYAGTDAGGFLPHGLIADEVAELATYGLSTFDALGAASWRAREWLGRPARLDEGVPASFCVYSADPLADLGALKAPARVVLRGRVVG